MPGPLPLGVYLEDGRSLAVLSDEDAMWEWCKVRLSLPERAYSAASSRSSSLQSGLPSGANTEGTLGSAKFEGRQLDDLKLAGWAVLFGAQTSPEIKRRLKPLIEFRRQQSNRSNFRVFEGVRFGFKPGQTAAQWLAQIGISANTAVPEDQPFYLMIVASPEDIPFQFQSELDSDFGVGRLWLEKPEDYAAYAEAVIENEQTGHASVRRELRFFAPRFPGDQATELVCSDLVERLIRKRKIGADCGFKAALTSGKKATRDALVNLYARQKDRPAIYFPASHGVLCAENYGGLANVMGAILAEPWAAGTTPKADSYMAAHHLKPDTDLRGTFHVLCACYGAGWPQVSSYTNQPVAPAPMMARLPQAILAKGGLGVLGHVDEAWSYSYIGSDNGKGIDRTQEYESILYRLMNGARAGHATDEFNRRWSELGGQIAEMLRNQMVESAEALHNLWVEHDDARGYILHGDPAVRLNVEKMAPAA
jgi:hypothetical protein